MSLFAAGAALIALTLLVSASGAALIGAPCSSSADCSTAAYCAGSGPGCLQNATCTLLPAGGQPCGSACVVDNCAAGFFCHGTEHQCRPLLNVNASPSLNDGAGDGSSAGQCAGKPCAFVEGAACQCDSACADYGDCCSDQAEQCGVAADQTTASPTSAPPDVTATRCAERACSYAAAAQCQCDAACRDYDDCCADYNSVCNEEADTSGTTKAPGGTATQPPNAVLCASRACGDYNAAQACQCDEACVSNGDCCQDYAALCDTDSPATSTSAPQEQTTAIEASTLHERLLCINRGCKTYNEALSCQCDENCADWGDCCEDYVDFCVTTSTTPGPTTAAAGQCPQGFVPGLDAGCEEYAWRVAPEPALPLLPVALAEISAVVLENQIFFFGDGLLGTQDNRYTLAFNLTSRTFASLGATAPRPFWGDHSAVEVYNGELFAFAGLCCQQFCDGCNATSKVQIYSPSSNAWREGAPVPWELDGAASAARIGDDIYVCGGLSKGLVTARCGIYSPALNTWRHMPRMPRAAHHTAAGTDGKAFYIFGGRQGGNTLSMPVSDVQVFDPVSFAWRSSRQQGSGIPPLPTPRTGMGKAAFLRGEFYIMGGEWYPEDHPDVLAVGTFDVVEIYNPVTQRWRKGLPMPIGLHGLHPVVWQDQIFVPGGNPAIDRGGSRTLQVYGPRAD